MISGFSSMTRWILVLGVARCVMCLPAAQQGSGLSLCSVRANGVLDCKVKKGQTLDYRNLRDRVGKDLTRQFKLRITCDGGQLVLPWPFRARNIISLEVYGCTVMGFLAEMTVPATIPDQLQTLILADVTIEIPFADMVYLNKNIAKVPWETDCGQMTLGTLVLRNLHYNIKISPEDRDSHSEHKLRFGFGGNNQHAATNPCVYPNLKFVDESGSLQMGHYHLRLLPEYSEFPKLEVYNMSNNHMAHVPLGFKHLHSKKFPVLRHLDFSNNALSEFEFDFAEDIKLCSIKVIDLRHNYITSVPLKSTQQLKNIGTIFVDLRENPLRCNCRLAPFWEYLQSQYHRTTVVQQRQLVSAITCNNGPLLQGKRPETSLLDIAFDKLCKR